MAIDFHNHLLPGVDDGAANLGETRAALSAMREQGVTAVVVTPHLDASVTEQPNELARRLEVLDVAFADVKQMAATEFPGLRLERGVELMLDSPRPLLDDPRVRLAGTKFLLVEFPGLMVPPHSVQALYELKLQGWRPIVVHPERYRNLEDHEVVDEWRSVGCFLQVNAGSILGRYGDRAEKFTAELFRRGWVDYISSDYHCRGRVHIAECRERLVASGGVHQARLLFDENPARMLSDEEPEPVPGLDTALPFWKRMFGRR